MMIDDRVVKFDFCDANFTGLYHNIVKECIWTGGEKVQSEWCSLTPVGMQFRLIFNIFEYCTVCLFKSSAEFYCDCTSVFNLLNVFAIGLGKGYFTPEPTRTRRLLPVTVVGGASHDHRGALPGRCSHTHTQRHTDIQELRHT